MARHPFPAESGQVSSWMVAAPWLVYSELMNADDPRAHEAALELRREFLTQ